MKPDGHDPNLATGILKAQQSEECQENVRVFSNEKTTVNGVGIFTTLEEDCSLLNTPPWVSSPDGSPSSFPI